MTPQNKPTKKRDLVCEAMLREDEPPKERRKYIQADEKIQYEVQTLYYTVSIMSWGFLFHSHLFIIR